jgi:Na+-transporting methylmalonyl-CoA/oxaloacetate decarboxylase gamma subunit
MDLTSFLIGLGIGFVFAIICFISFCSVIGRQVTKSAKDFKNNDPDDWWKRGEDPYQDEEEEREYDEK